MNETLTDEERAAFASWQELRAWPELRDKALRIIDAHTADRAALVARLEKAERSEAEALKVKEWQLFEHKAQRLQSEVTSLTEALAAMTSESDSLHRMFDAEHAKLNAAEARVRELEAEKTHLLGIEAEPDAAGLYHDRVHRDPPGQRPARTGGPQAVERDLRAQLAELTRERDEARAGAKAHYEARQCAEQQWESAQEEVTRLTEALAAAEGSLREEQRASRQSYERALAAEARVRSLESAAREMVRVVQTDPLDVDDVEDAAEALEAALGGDVKAQDPAAENRRNAAGALAAWRARVKALEGALADRQRAYNFRNFRSAEARVAAEARVEALETLLAASEARAAQWQSDAESYRIDATVAQDRLAALRGLLRSASLALPSPWPLPPETGLAIQEALRG